MERFVVGTGRCGSTLLSRMLAENRNVLSVFEFFTGLDMTKRFGSEPVDGPVLAALIGQEHPFVTMVLSRGYEVEEITYPFGPSSRYQPSDHLPWVLVSTLPRLTDDPDALFDETLAFATTLPRQPLAQHYRQLFVWWGERLGKSCWVERSGSSIDYVGGLHELYSNARFVHLHRDGPETSLSMREHAAYRLAISLLYQLPAEGAPSIDSLRAVDPGIAADASDSISRMLASSPPVEYFGRYWSQELVNGFAALPKLRGDQLLAVSFEDLVSSSVETLRAIGDYLALPADDGWVERGAALVRGVPPARFGTLSPDEQASLSDACAEGMRLLGRAS